MDDPLAGRLPVPVEQPTGRGVALCTRLAGERLGMRVYGDTVAIQGYGNVGSVAARVSDKALGRS